MSAKAIVNEVVALLTAEFTALTVVKGIPRSLPEGDVLYLFHQGSADVNKAGQGIIKRSHLIAMRLWIHPTVGDEAQEDALMDYTDSLTDYWYTHHKVGNLADNAKLSQPDGEDVRAAFDQYTIDGSQEYRQRYFVLRVDETVGFTMS